MTTKTEQLELILERMGETVLATTETVERLAERIETLAEQVQNQEHHIQQQGYQIFALSESLQTLVDSQTESREQLTQLTYLVHTLVNALNNKNQS